MAKTEMIRARMEPELKHEAEKIFSALGLSPTEALPCSTNRLLFITVCLLDLFQARSGEGLITYGSVDELMAEFEGVAHTSSKGMNPDKLRIISCSYIVCWVTGCWECHIEPGWLLVWDEDEESVTLMRTGTHSDLFKCNMKLRVDKYLNFRKPFQETGLKLLFL